jgi:hypothetical protein
MPSSGILRHVAVTRATRPNNPEDGIHHSHRLEKSQILHIITSWGLKRRRKVSPVRYKLDFLIPENGILQVAAVNISNLTYFIFIRIRIKDSHTNTEYLQSRLIVFKSTSILYNI